MAILQENAFREREARLKKFWEDNQIYRFKIDPTLDNLRAST